MAANNLISVVNNGAANTCYANIPKQRRTMGTAHPLHPTPYCRPYLSPFEQHKAISISSYKRLRNHGKLFLLRLVKHIPDNPRTTDRVFHRSISVKNILRLNIQIMRGR